MAATKSDQLLTEITERIKEIALDDTAHGLDLEEAARLAELGEEISKLHNQYMDRLIIEAADNVRNPEKLVFQADADMDEMDRARERVRLRLIEKGVPLGETKKGTIH